MNWEEREEERVRTRREKLGRRANSSQHDCFFLPRENTPILDKIRFTFDPNSSLRSGSLKNGGVSQVDRVFQASEKAILVGEKKRVFRSPGAQKRHCTLQMLHDGDHHHRSPPSAVIAISINHHHHHHHHPMATSHHRSPVCNRGYRHHHWRQASFSSYATYELAWQSLSLPPTLSLSPSASTFCP